jgi:hypothetical protein
MERLAVYIVLMNKARYTSIFFPMSDMPECAIPIETINTVIAVEFSNSTLCSLLYTTRFTSL